MGIVISTHLPPPVMIESTASRAWVTHMLCWTWAIYFAAAVSSENDQGNMNLASNTAPVPSTMPSRVDAIQGIAECLTRRCTPRRVIGIQSGPRGCGSTVASMILGSRGWDADCGDDCEDPTRVFCTGQAD